MTRNIATDATGTPLADWAAGGSGWRRYLSNGHGDLVATLDAGGAVTTSLRLDPWGVPLRAVPTGYPAFGFQGSLTDRSTSLVYARSRWYDPTLATFTSEDPYPGELADPSSRHRYAYLTSARYWPMLLNANRGCAGGCPRGRTSRWRSPHRSRRRPR